MRPNGGTRHVEGRSLGLAHSCKLLTNKLKTKNCRTKSGSKTNVYVCCVCTRRTLTHLLHYYTMYSIELQCNKPTFLLIVEQLTEHNNIYIYILITLQLVFIFLFAIIKMKRKKTKIEKARGATSNTKICSKYVNIRSNWIALYIYCLLLLVSLYCYIVLFDMCLGAALLLH